ncbi:MAG: hypothetical protein RDV48_00975 [Candidatus Eremiobacteraeota bacterium]|nr:hypothetical protein [Candidatus Eremiobacteraeota bacterium]
MPDKLIPIGEMRWTTGVMVTAGKEWVTRIITEVSPLRIEGGTYSIPTPSSQLLITKEVSAGYLIEDSGRERTTKWVSAGKGTFTEPVPDKIPDKNTFVKPAENVKNELMLIIIYALGLNARVYVDSNYLYLYTKNAGGRAVWKLKTQFNTSNFVFDDKTNEGSCTLELAK